MIAWFYSVIIVYNVFYVFTNVHKLILVSKTTNPSFGA